MTAAINQDLDLSTLVAEAGDDTYETGRPSAFRDGLAYPVEVTKSEVTESANGWYVLKMTLSKVKEDGTTGQGETVIQCLPTFSEEIQGSQDAEKITGLKKNWGDRLHAILRAALPDVFQIYASSSKNGGRWKFFDKDGVEISGSDKRSREQNMAKAVLAFSARLVAGKASIEGARMYYVRSSSQKDPNKKYDNFYSEQPNKFPLA